VTYQTVFSITVYLGKKKITVYDVSPSEAVQKLLKEFQGRDLAALDILSASAEFKEIKY